MSKEGTLITVGVLVILSPFLGLPSSFLAFALPVLGAITLFVGYTIRKEKVNQRAAEAPAAPALSHEMPSPIA